MNINEITVMDDEGREFFPYALAASNLAKASANVPQHAEAAAVCLEVLAREIRRAAQASDRARAELFAETVRTTAAALNDQRINAGMEPISPADWRQFEGNVQP